MDDEVVSEMGWSDVLSVSFVQGTHTLTLVDGLRG